MSEDRPRGEQTPQSPPSTGENGPHTVNSTDILQGGREVFIQHGEKRYRLRVTRSGKLILN